MSFFSENFWLSIIISVTLISLISVYYWITDKKEGINSLMKYFGVSILMLFIFKVYEDLILLKLLSPFIIIIIEIEFIVILIALCVNLFLIRKNFRSNLILYFHSIMVLLAFHIFVVGLPDMFITGTLIITITSVVISIIVIPFDEEYKLIAFFIGLSLFFYTSIIIDVLALASLILCLVSLTIAISNESFRNRLVSSYQTIALKLSNSKSHRVKEVEPKKMKKNNKILFWQARVKISQGVLSKNIEYGNEKKESEITWLKDFFSDKHRYGLELKSDKEFRWNFFLKARDEKTARILGEALLSRITSIYPGLDGSMELKPITKQKIYKNNQFWEIQLPKPPYMEKFTIINDFINLFHRSDKKVKLIIMWKRADNKKVKKFREKVGNLKFKDEDEKKRLLAMWQDEIFRVRIYIHYQINQTDPLLKEQELQTLEGKLKSLTLSCRNNKKAAQLKRVPLGTQGNIQRVNLISGSYLTSKCVDFNVPENIPLTKPFKLENENIKHIPISESDPNHILIGNYVNNGRSTKRKILLHKNSFAQSLLIAGQQGTGKTYLLAQVVNEFYTKKPDVGILILNLGKGNQEIFYKVDKVIKFGSSEFRVPYFHKGQYLDRSLQETANYLIASLGLKNIVEKNMVNVMNSFLNKKGKLPNSLKTLFQNLLKYFEQYPYHVKFQTNIVRAIKNRVLSLLSNKILTDTLRLKPDTAVPTWFTDWQNGKKIFLDFSMCTIYEKRLLTSAIFQLIRVLIPDREAGKLKNIILIDEAHQILEKPITNNYDDDDFISREQLEKIFNELLREFRSKGLSFILSDQTPSRLFDCVTTLPSLKIIFRVGYPCNTTMLGNPVEQEFLMCQKNRQALILNGINGEKFIIETLDLKVDKPEVKEEMIESHDKILCPYCGKPAKDTDLMCSNCSEPLVSELLDSQNRFNLEFLENRKKSEVK
ncbi:MAG: hypothetical protein HWN80_18580 [Candidatus Lokiarchaeota archaeon]|nr:hypothetical protein [Candidatus Lokiarchaeota archaeon]